MFIPSLTKWKSWSQPTKIQVFGTFITIVSVLLAILFYLFPNGSGENHKSDNFSQNIQIDGKNSDQVVEYYGDMIKGDKIHGDKISGDKLTVINKSSDPNYLVDLIGGRNIISGKSVQLLVRAKQPVHLKGISCKWKFFTKENIQINASLNGCNSTVTPLYKKFTRDISGNYVKATATIERDGNTYEAITEFYVSPDTSSQAYQDFIQQQARDMTKRVKSSTENQLSGASEEILSIQKQATDFGIQMKRQQLVSTLATRPTRVIECKLGGCRLEVKTFCEAGATLVKFGKDGRSWPFKYLIKDCAQLHSSRNNGICLKSTLDIPALVPNEKLEGLIEWADSSSTPFSLLIPNKVGGFDNTKQKWLQLQPYIKSTGAPYAAIRYDSGIRNIRFIFGAGGCGSERISFLYDNDGKGLIESAHMTRPNVPFKIRLPKGSYIDIAYDSENGKRIGSFRYSFNMEEFLAHATGSYSLLRLKCSLRKAHGASSKVSDRTTSCKIPPRDNLMLWSAIDEIYFGEDSTKLENVIKLDISEDHLLSSLRGQDVPENYGFDVPKDWTDVFYQYKLKDGRKKPIVRVSLLQ